MSRSSPKPVRAGIPRVRATRHLKTDLAYRLNRCALYVLLAAYVPGTLALVAAVIGGILWFDAWAWGDSARLLRRPSVLLLVVSLNVLALSLAALLLWGLLPLFFRETHPPPGGLRLMPTQHPSLFALIERLCKRLDIAPPDACLLVPFDNAGIADLDIERPDGGVNRRVRTLILGAGLVTRARINELATVICHELAHAATGDTRMGRRASRFFRSLDAACGLHADDEGATWLNAIVRGLLVAYACVFVRTYAADNRYRELRADRISAEVCGPQNVRDMLIKSYLAGRVPELSIEALWQEYSLNGQELENLFAEHRRRWAALPEHRRQRAENEMFLEPTGPWDSHPSLATRIRNLAEVEAPELSGDQPATRLFRAWDGIEERITGRLLAVGREISDAYVRHLDRNLRFGR